MVWSGVECMVYRPIRAVCVVMEEECKIDIFMMLKKNYKREHLVVICRCADCRDIHWCIVSTFDRPLWGSL